MSPMRVELETTSIGISHTLKNFQCCCAYPRSRRLGQRKPYDLLRLFCQNHSRYAFICCREVFDSSLTANKQHPAAFFLHDKL